MGQWNYAFADLGAGSFIRPELGPGGLSRKSAHAHVRRTLEKHAKTEADYWDLVARWKRGARDDTVAHGSDVYAIYEYEGDDPGPAGWAWLKDIVDVMRVAGMTVWMEGDDADAMTPDPIEGHLGQVSMTGWIGQDPSGGDASFLMVTSPDPGIPHAWKMRIMATALGINETPGTMTTDPTARVALDGDRWIRLIGPPPAEYTYRVSDEWEQVAHAQGRVVLVLSYRPQPPTLRETQELVDGFASDPEAFTMALVPIAGPAT